MVLLPGRLLWRLGAALTEALASLLPGTLCVNSDAAAPAPRGVDDRLERRLEPRLEGTLLVCDALADPLALCGVAKGVVAEMV